MREREAQALQAVVLELQNQVLSDNLSDATKAVSYRAHELLCSLRQLLANALDGPCARLVKAVSPACRN